MLLVLGGSGICGQLSVQKQQSFRIRHYESQTGTFPSSVVEDRDRRIRMRCKDLPHSLQKLWRKPCLAYRSLVWRFSRLHETSTAVFLFDRQATGMFNTVFISSYFS